ncbi:SRPBCC domain-containing protein [Sinimarinibacterium thermocellulolyticum]|uniref:SRPBCC domain-containing protein n=1 Tax=Sinimarinibacterium thermocellulolyticum TaxID=3170016 RepID=A0ABV2A6T7_9GAMM
MFTVDRTLDIDAPADVVWQVLTDFAHYGEWNPFVPEARCELRPGGAIEMQVKLRDKPQFQREWVHSVGPGQTFSYRMKPVPLGALRSERVQMLQALGPNRTRYISHFELAGWLQPLVSAIFGEAMRQGFEAMALGLKRQAEAKARR